MPRHAHSARITIAMLTLAVTAGLTSCAAGAAAGDPHSAHEPLEPVSTPTPASTSPRPADVSVSGPVVEITVDDVAFTGPDAPVSVGSSITVTNTGQVEHTWTSDEAGIDSGVIAPGDSFTFTAQTPGTFAYYCAFHAGMQGTITVT